MKQNYFLAVSLLCLTITTGCSNPVKTTQLNSSTNQTSNSVKLGFSAWPGWLPWNIAQDKGLFKSRNVNVKTKWFENYNESIAALESGAVEANSQTLGDTISSIAKGNDLVVVLTTDNSTGNDMIIVDQKIKSIKDLKGKKVAAEEGTVDHFLLVQALKRAGMSIKDVNFIPLETNKATDAFFEKKVDAVAAFAPFTTKALKRPGSRELFSSRDFPGTISDHLVFKRKFVDEYPEKVQAMVDSWFDTLEYISNNVNKEESDKNMAKRANVNIDEYQEYLDGIKIFTAQENIETFRNGADNTYLPQAAIETSKFLFENNLTKKRVNTDKIFDNRFVNNYINRMKK